MPGSQNHICLGCGKSRGALPLPGQSPLASPASCQVSSACSWRSRQLPFARFFSVQFGLAHSKAVWDGVCCRMLPTEKQHGCMVLAVVVRWLLRGPGGEVPVPEWSLYLTLFGEGI